MRYLLAISILCFLVSIGTASHAKGDDERVQALEQKVTTMEKTRASNNQQVASALSRFGALQDEFAQLKGQIEANRHLVGTQYSELGKRLTDLDHRIQSIEDRLTIFSTQLSKALGKVAPAAAAEGDLYQKGLDLVASSRYLEAASTFESFIRKYPKSSFVASAKLWIAECFYSMRDYQRAIQEYQKFIDNYPRSDKIPETVLKQANCFYELGMLDEARVFYDQVISRHPTSSAAAQAKEKIARIEGKKAQLGASQSDTGLETYPTKTLEQKMKEQYGDETGKTGQNKGESGF
ncbi:MAG: tol-pal system protein YbgF [Pseudomonadota bacterium]